MTQTFMLDEISLWDQQKQSIYLKKKQQRKTSLHYQVICKTSQLLYH